MTDSTQFPPGEYDAIAARIAKEKVAVIEQLKKIPIVQVSCAKAGVGRSSYYRWREEDPNFAKDADAAIKEGKVLISELATSKLISNIEDKNMTAIIFWLKHHDPDFREIPRTVNGSGESKPQQNITVRWQNDDEII